MDGRELERLVELSIDGELDPAEEATLSQELQAPEARARFERARRFQDELRQKLQVEACPTPPDLRTRVVQTIRTEDFAQRSKPWGRVTAGTMGVAALVAVSFAVDGARLDPEEAVSKHILELPPTYRVRGDSEEIQRLFKERLGFPVELPPISQRNPNVRFVGARLDELKNRDAAYLMYDYRGARVSVFVYGGEGKLTLPTAKVRTTVEGLDVEGGRHRNYNFVEFRSPSRLQVVMVSEIDIPALLDMVAAFASR